MDSKALALAKFSARGSQVKTTKKEPASGVVSLVTQMC